ncbi:MAG: HlyD family efflux transporter periplasmic adaptor subunit [Magnetococcales bacterium]|nr:HlyD family efflux transporter periplasmic adaptor subunit [Magnetococcales bacterium]
MAEQKSAVKVEQAYMTPIRHPITAARLLYSAPDWTLRGSIHIIFAIVMAFMVYSFWAKKDQLVTAPLTLKRESATIEAVDGGLVTRVHVREGDRVNALDPLVDVQKTQVRARSEGESLETQRLDLEKTIEQATKEYLHSKRQLDLALSNVAKDQSLLTKQLEKAQDTVRTLENKVAQARENFAKEDRLFKSKDITKADHDRARNAVDDVEKALRDAKVEVDKLQVSLSALSEEKIKNDIAQNEQRYKDQSDRQKRELERVEKLIKEEQGMLGGVSREGSQTSYQSTLTGMVSQVHVKSGNMINGGEPMVTLIKESAALEAQVLVMNKDIGRLKKGQIVQIKYFAYPYQEYGIPTGVISDIATRPGGGKGAGNESMYVVRVALNEETIALRGEKPRPLEIGLEGFAEIKTGEKRFIELMFSPISKFFTQQEE